MCRTIVHQVSRLLYLLSNRQDRYSKWRMDQWRRANVKRKRPEQHLIKNSRVELRLAGPFDSQNFNYLSREPNRHEQQIVKVIDLLNFKAA